MKVKILGVTLDMELEELTNPAIAKKYEDSIAQTFRAIRASTECEQGYEGVQMQCQAISDAFTALFGEKNAIAVLGDQNHTNLFRCLDAFDELTALYPKQVTPALEKRAEKYSRSRLDGR